MDDDRTTTTGAGAIGAIGRALLYLALVLATATAALAATIATATIAHAQAQARRAIVLDLSGPGSGAARGDVVRAIEGGGWEVVPERELARAQARVGADAASREVAAEVGASVTLEGRVERRGRRFTLSLTVRDAASGAVLADESFRGRGAGRMRAEVRRELWDRVGGAMARGSVPTVVATQRAAGAEGASASGTRRPERAQGADAAGGSEDEGASASSSAPGPSPLWVAVGMTAFSRDYSYTDDLYLALRPYQLPIGATARAQARWYPAAHFTQDFVANVGLDVSFGAALGLRSRQRDGTTFGTESLDFRAGVDVRIPLAPVELGVGLGYGVHTFALGASEDGQSAQLPNVEYQHVRPALRARLDVGAGIYVESAFGWRFLTSTGALGSEWFPRSSGSGFDLGAWVGWESDLGLGVRAGFEMQRYFFSMSPEPGDAHVAGGAVDQYLAGSVDLVWRAR